jgi:CPA1 family monovalent cation:H+ antiporter
VAELKTPTATVLQATVGVIAVVIAGRFLWVYLSVQFTRLVPWIRNRDRVSLASMAIVSWAGMRGVVTLAAALTLPLTLPDRSLLIWLAFAVIVMTLVLQGLTLPFLIRKLNVPADDPNADALAEAGVQHEASKAALDRLYELADTAPVNVVEQLRQLAGYRSNAAWERLGSHEEESPSQAYSRLRREMLGAEREVFRLARNSGRVPEEVLRAAQRDMDLEESLLERRDDE